MNEHKLKPSDVEEVCFRSNNMKFELRLTPRGRAKMLALKISEPLSFTVETDVESGSLEACCAIAAPGLFYACDGDTDSIFMAFNGIPYEYRDDVYIDEGQTLECLQGLSKALLKPAIDTYFARLAYVANCKTLFFTLPEPLNVTSSTTHWLVKNSSARPLRDFRALSNHGKYYIRGFIWNVPGTAAPAEAAKWVE